MRNDILLIAPDDLFQQLEQIITNKPELLITEDWHQMLNGSEAFSSDQILKASTRHDLAGWIVALTPRAAEFERCRVDVDDYANNILTMNLRRPIPQAIFMAEDRETLIKIIKMRADEERVVNATRGHHLYN